MGAISIPVLKGLVAGEYGKTNTVTLKDFDGTAQNVSTYTGITVVFTSEEGATTVTATGSFYTDGSDGKVSWSFSSGAGSYLDREGDWDMQVELTKTNTKAKSYVCTAEVGKGLR